MKQVLGYFLLFTVSFLSCEREVIHEKSPWRNHSDSAQFVGIESCKTCHSDKFESFQHTGMGSSFDHASLKKSAADFSGHPVIYDTFSGYYYSPLWLKDSLFIKEFRLEGKDTSWSRTERVDYIIGSGQHTNSHLQHKNNFLYQMPMTWYAQKKQWDLPPGFEGGNNSRFSRKIGLECMSCHNAIPNFTMGSENKYESLPLGIDCERCHGPGSLHVEEKSKGIIIDTASFIDYSIVNPGKLALDLQFDVCQRCHLQGNAVLTEGKSFLDFRPGMKLADFIRIFLPVYEGGEEEFIMASHADRLKKSKCFISTFKAEEHKNELRPHKNALTCITCHNPHVSVRLTGREIFKAACEKCHQKNSGTLCSEELELRKSKNDDCMTCHMPKSGSVDIPHVTVTDHFIRKAVPKPETEKIRNFVRLACINHPAPTSPERLMAFLQQFERFEKKKIFLDSAFVLLPKAARENKPWAIHGRIHLLYLIEDYHEIENYVSLFGPRYFLDDLLIKTSYDNQDAWTAYRIGEAYFKTGKYNTAADFYALANHLAPFIPEFENKIASILILLNNLLNAEKWLINALEKDPTFVPALNNLGYVSFLKKNPEKADMIYKMAYSIDPLYVPLLMNRVALYLQTNQKLEAKKMLEAILRIQPNHAKAKILLHDLVTK